MEAIAKLRNHPTSPRKMRMVADTIRGLDVDKALNVLKFSEKSAARPLEKLLMSALNNWVAKNEGERVEDAQLYIKTIFVDGARTLKRFRPAPMGRAYRIRKRSNHVTLIIDSRVTQSPTGEELVKEEETTEAATPASATPQKKVVKSGAEKTEKPISRKTNKTKKTKNE
jgi:large subunit ribosomal protein L22